MIPGISCSAISISRRPNAWRLIFLIQKSVNPENTLQLDSSELIFNGNDSISAPLGNNLKKCRVRLVEILIKNYPDLSKFRKKFTKLPPGVYGSIIPEGGKITENTNSKLESFFLFFCLFFSYLCPWQVNAPRHLPSLSMGLIRHWSQFTYTTLFHGRWCIIIWNWALNSPYAPPPTKKRRMTNSETFTKYVNI